MHKTIHAQSGHTLYIESIAFEDLPENVKAFQFIRNYKKHYVVKNWHRDGRTFLYLGKDRLNGKKNEIVVWYPKGGFWSGYGENFEDAINSAQRDGWMYA